MTFNIDHQTLDDLVETGRVMRDANDIEPWAMLIRDLHEQEVINREETHWVITLHNSYDAFSSAWQAYNRWNTPHAWATAPDQDDARDYPIMTERRNLHGGRILKKLHNYLGHVVGSGTQESWLRQGLTQATPENNFRSLQAHMRKVWGVGRQSAFEWAEFVQKALDFPITAADAELWESSGPRKSLQRIYGNPKPDLAWLNQAANHARQYMADNGVDLAWEDFETVICDFNVMRDGRYYPGQHLAFLKQEIMDVPDRGQQTALWSAWERLIPEIWQDIPPGINKAYRAEYATNRTIRSHA